MREEEAAEQSRVGTDVEHRVARVEADSFLMVVADAKGLSPVNDARLRLQGPGEKVQESALAYPVAAYDTNLVAALEVVCKRVQHTLPLPVVRN